MEPVFHYSIHPIFLHLFSHSCVIFLPLFGITHPTLRSTMHSARFFPCGIGIVPSKSHLVWCCRAVQAPWPSQRLPPAAGTDPVIHASRLSYLIFLFSSQSVSQILRTLFSSAQQAHPASFPFSLSLLLPFLTLINLWQSLPQVLCGLHCFNYVKKKARHLPRFYNSCYFTITAILIQKTHCVPNQHSCFGLQFFTLPSFQFPSPAHVQTPVHYL